MDTPDVVEYLDDDTDGPDTDTGVILDEPIDQLVQAKFSQPLRTFREFIAKGNFRAEKRDPHTNIIDNTDKRSYIIPPTRITEFFTKLEACRMDGRTMHFAERQETADTANTGIVIDLDVYQSVGARIVTNRHLHNIVHRINRVLVRSLDFMPNEPIFEYHAFVISRAAVTAADEKIYKDGFHIVIPEVRVTREYKDYLIGELIREEAIPNAMRDIMPQIVRPEKLLDRMSRVFPVCFVGSAKAGGTAYPLTHVYRISSELGGSDYVSIDLIPDVDRIANGQSPDGRPINLVYEMSLGFYFDYLGEARTWLTKTEYEYRAELEGKIQVRNEKRLGGILDDEEIEDNENEVDILTTGNAEASYLKKLLGIIDISYATEYEKWFKVICAIANTNVRYRPLAIYFSHRNPNAWSASELDRVWNEGLNSRDRAPITKRSIIFWAKESSPERFREIEQENYQNILARAVFHYEGKINHAEAARVIYSMIGDKFACDVNVNDKSGKLREWYEFVLPEQSHKAGEVYKWRREDDPDVLRCFMIDHLPKVYDAQLERIKERKEQAETENERKYWSAVEMNLKKSQNDLGNDTYQSRVVKQCQLRFRVRGFTTELDNYPDVIGVGNGVLKLGIKPQLIQRFHEYRISKFTPTRYRPYSPTNPFIRELMQILRDIIIEPDAFEFIMFYLATQIDLAEVAGMWLQIVGGGRNGKSFITKMLRETLGDQYIAQFKSALLTGPDPKAEAANSALMILRGKTGAFCDEFNAGEVVNSKLAKSLANPGRMTGRDNYENEGSFRNTSNIIASSNYELSTTDTDYGFWRRVRYYTARVRFVENPDPRNPYEKRVNTKIMDEYPYDRNYQEAFLSILVHYHTRLHIEYGGDIKRVPCATIARQTEEYHNRQDSLNRFINLLIVKSPHAPSIVLEDLGNAYINWYKQNVRNTVKFDMTTLIGQIVTSKLDTAIATRDDGVRELKEHRLRDSIDDPLLEGESYLFHIVDRSAVPPGGDNDTTSTDVTTYIKPNALLPPQVDIPANVGDRIDEYGEDDMVQHVPQNKAAARARAIAARKAQPTVGEAVLQRVGIKLGGK